jgi:uncharacterized protein (DUF362 family)
MGERKMLSANRREVLLAAAGAVASVTCGLGQSKAMPAASADRARVGVARDGNVVGADGGIDPAGAGTLLGRALARALGTFDAVAGLKRLFSPLDVVGIKVSCLAGRGLSTHSELVDALVAKLVQAGVRADNIVVWDKSDSDLRRAKYTIRRSGQGPLYYGTNDDYEDEPIEAGAVGGCLSRILTRKATAIVNVPILKDHDLAGISGALKSFYGAIHNPNKYHDNGCNPYVADLCAHPSIRRKVRLTVFDALVPQCHGGPAYVPAHTWKLGAVFASLDAVAADTTAVRMIEEKRKELGMDSLAKAGRAPQWLAKAAQLGLGIGDAQRIDEVAR